MIDLDLSGVFFASRKAAQHILASGNGGVIINISSLAGSRGEANTAAYVAAKHGVEGLTKSLSAEFAPQGIRVLNVAPTYVQTPGTEGVSEDMRQHFQERIPLGRAAVPNDIARTVLFCASDLSLFLTGSTLYLDRGQMALL